LIRPCLRVEGCLAVVLLMGAGTADCTPAQNAPSVRATLEQRYEENRAAFMARDSSAVMRLRHPGFHTRDASGLWSERPEFAARTGLLLRAVVRFDSMSFRMDSLEVRGDTAVAVVRQHALRRQRLRDGAVHNVETGSVQREWWLRTNSGWLMWRVDQVRQDPVKVDGRVRSP